MRPYCKGRLAFARTSISQIAHSIHSTRVQTGASRCFSESYLRRSGRYAETIPYLGIGADTRVIFQGFTGRQATQNAKQSLEYGTRIVGGVTPGRDGEHLGLPVLPTIRAAKEQLQPDATAVYVAAGQAASAIEEAIEAEIPLIVAVAEHIPTVDLLRVNEILRTQSRSRLVGPNSPGIISAVGKCRIGFQPLPCFQPGVVGIVARSGTLSYETVASTTRAGIGQSLVIGMGGDMLPGTDFVDALTLFEHHEQTKGIILIGEIGGVPELRAAEWISMYRKRTKDPKPIMALIAGFQAPLRTVMGHAGAFARNNSEHAEKKVKALMDAGVAITNHPAKFGTCMKKMLDDQKCHGLSYDHSMRAGPSSPSIGGSQRRNIHTTVRRPRPSVSRIKKVPQRYGHFLTSDRSLQLLQAHSIPIAADRTPDDSNDIIIRIGIDRPSRRLCAIITTGECYNDRYYLKVTKFGTVVPLEELLGSNTESTSSQMRKRAPSSVYFRSKFRKIRGRGTTSQDPTGYLPKLMRIFFDEGAFSLDAGFKPANQLAGPVYEVTQARLGLDALAYEGPKVAPEVLDKLQVELPKLSPEEEAAKDGIVYVKLGGAGTIGTLVNGAGLAMNTVDAIADLGGSCANFLDTGGKATSATVKTSFQLVLSDPRVKVIFVNIFGGLTLCDMIAEGIMLAYKDLGIKVPVVVRLRGTNEEIGQKMIAESGLPLHAFDDFEEAALKAIELAPGSQPEA